MAEGAKKCSKVWSTFLVLPNAPLSRSARKILEFPHNGVVKVDCRAKGLWKYWFHIPTTFCISKLFRRAKKKKKRNLPQFCFWIKVPSHCVGTRILQSCRFLSTNSHLASGESPAPSTNVTKITPLNQGHCAVTLFWGKSYMVWIQFYYRTCPKTRASLSDISGVLASLFIWSHHVGDIERDDTPRELPPPQHGGVTWQIFFLKWDHQNWTQYFGSSLTNALFSRIITSSMWHSWA